MNAQPKRIKEVNVFRSATAKEVFLKIDGKWHVLPPKEARELGKLLISTADQLDPGLIVVPR